MAGRSGDWKQGSPSLGVARAEHDGPWHLGNTRGGLTIPIIITDTRKRMQHVGDAQRAGLDGLGFDRRTPNITISPYTSGGSN